MGWRSWFGIQEKPERRASVDAGEEFVEFLTRKYGGTGTPSARQGAAIQQAASLVGRCFASARVTNARPTVEAALKPSVLFALGRNLVISGECLFYLRVSGDGLRLYEVSSYEVAGDYAEDSWSYTLELSGPTRAATVRTSRDRVVHIRYTRDATEPWKGVGPIVEARSTLGLDVGLSQHLHDEVAGPHGTLIPTPDGAHDLSALSGDLTKLKGNVALVRSMVGQWQSGGGGHMVPSASDWKVQRLGANPSSPLIDLVKTNADSVLALAGVSPGLFAGDGGASREAFRQLQASLIEPLAALVLEELRERLDDPGLGLRFDKLRAADVTARARATNSFVQAGVPVERALILAGID